MHNSSGADEPREGLPTGIDDGACVRPARDVAVQIVGRFANLVLAVFITIFVVRSLGDERFGEWSSLLAVIALTQALCDLGFKQVAVRRAAADPAAEPAWIGALVKLRLVLSIVAFAISAAVVATLATSHEMRVAGLILSATLLLSTLSALDAIFQLRVRNDLTIAIVTVNSLLWGTAAVVVLGLDGDIVALAVGFVVALAVSNVLLVILALTHGRVRLRNVGDRWPEMLRVGIPIAIGSVLVLSYGRIDQILVFQLAGAEEAGLYGAVYRMLDQAQFVPISVATTVLPLLAAAYRNDQVRFRVVLQSAAAMLIAFALGAFVFALTYAESFVVLLFGEEFEPAGEILPVLIAALVPISLGYLLGVVVIVTGRQRAFVLVACAGLVFNVVANLLLIPRWGFVAAAWVTLLTEVFVLALVWRAVRSYITTSLDLGRITRIAYAGAATLALLIGLRLLSVPVAAAILVTAVAYPAALLAFKASSTTELRQLLRAGGRAAT